MHSVRCLIPLLLAFACSNGDKDPSTDTETPSDTEPTDSTPPLPELCINEYMASNVSSLELEDGTTPDWFELHNPTAAAIDLEGWLISDDVTLPDKHTLGAGLTVPANGFLLLYADSDPEEGPDHLPYNMSKLGEQIVITSPDGEQEAITYGPMASDFSFARSPDCCREDDCWVAVSGGTPGATNTP